MAPTDGPAAADVELELSGSGLTFTDGAAAESFAGPGSSFAVADVELEIPSGFSSAIGWKFSGGDDDLGFFGASSSLLSSMDLFRLARDGEDCA